MKRYILTAALLAPVVASWGATWRQEVEADWLRQQTKRQEAATASGHVTCAEDASGGVDGWKSGKWGFHTESESNP